MKRFPVYASVFAIALSLVGTAASQTAAGKQTQERAVTDSSEVQIKALVQAKFDAWGAGTGSPFELLADDASWTIVGRSVASRTYNSREEFMREVIRPFNARMKSRLVPSIRHLYADGNTVIIFFDAESVAIDGNPYRNTYAWFMEFRGSKVIRATAFFDSIEFNELWARVAPPSG